MIGPRFPYAWNSIYQKMRVRVCFKLPDLLLTNAVHIINEAALIITMLNQLLQFCLIYYDAAQIITILHKLLRCCTNHFNAT